MKLGRLGFTGTNKTSRTSSLGVYRPETNCNLQLYNSELDSYTYSGKSKDFTSLIGGFSHVTCVVSSPNNDIIFLVKNGTTTDTSGFSSGNKTIYSIVLPQTGDISDAYVSGSLTLPVSNFFDNVTNKNPQIRGIAFKPDGTKMYILTSYYFGGGFLRSESKIFEYTTSLGSVWNITSYSYTGVNYALKYSPYRTLPGDSSTSARSTGESGLFFKEDGSEFWVVHNGYYPTTTTLFSRYFSYNSDSFYKYRMYSNWDLSTASNYIRYDLPVGVPEVTTVPAGTGGPYTIYEQPTFGMHFFLYSLFLVGRSDYKQDISGIFGTTNPKVVQYDLNSYENVTTGIDASSYQSFSLTRASSPAIPKGSEVHGIHVKFDGTAFYVCGYDVVDYETSTPTFNPFLVQYSMNNGNVSGSSFAGFLDVTSQTRILKDLTFNTVFYDKLFFIDESQLFQYNLKPGGTPGVISDYSFTQKVSLHTYIGTTNISLESIVFNSNGSKLFVLFRIGASATSNTWSATTWENGIIEFNLSSLFNISTISTNKIVSLTRTSPYFWGFRSSVSYSNKADYLGARAIQLNHDETRLIILCDRVFSTDYGGGGNSNPFSTSPNYGTIVEVPINDGSIEVMEFDNKLLREIPLDNSTNIYFNNINYKDNYYQYRLTETNPHSLYYDSDKNNFYFSGSDSSIIYQNKQSSTYPQSRLAGAVGNTIYTKILHTSELFSSNITTKCMTSMTGNDGFRTFYVISQSDNKIYQYEIIKQ